MTVESFERDALLGFADLATTNENAEVPLWAELTATGSARAGTPDPEAVTIWLDVTPEGIDSVTLAEYPVTDADGDTVLGIQARIACMDRDRVKGISSDLYALFHDRWGGMLGRVKLVNASRTSGTNVGQDSEGRLVRTENYYLRVHRPAPHRP